MREIMRRSEKVRIFFQLFKYSLPLNLIRIKGSKARFVAQGGYK